MPNISQTGKNIYILADADNLKMPNIGQTGKIYILADADNLKMPNIGQQDKYN